MEATTLTIHWHDNPIYSLNVQPQHDSSDDIVRLATAGGGENNVRLWKLKYDSGSSNTLENVEYLATLSKHTGAVNVVRFDPRGEVLASAGDDGMVVLWHKTEDKREVLGHEEDSETWIARHICRTGTREIYDLAWSPDSKYFITGSMDNVTRIYSAADGKCIRELVEHNLHVQGVCWDPLNEFVATQSADRSVNIYSLKKKKHGNSQDSSDSIDISPTIFYKISKAELPKTTASRRGVGGEGTGTSSGATSSSQSSDTEERESSVLSTPKAKRKILSGTASPNLEHAMMVVMNSPNRESTTSTLMDPPPPSANRKRRLSNSSTGSSGTTPSMIAPIKRSASPSPATLPAVVRPSVPLKPTMLYHNESLSTFFRRLSFSTDGSLLLTPSGIFKSMVDNGSKEEVTNTVYVYTRAGLNHPPVYHLPGLKKAAIAISFSPIKYKLRNQSVETVTTVSQKADVMPTTQEEAKQDQQPQTPKNGETSTSNTTFLKKPSLIALPYRMVFAVATLDSVVIYDTQQIEPLGMVNNLHYDSLTDLGWTNDGKTLIVSSIEGNCSFISMKEGFLGEVYQDDQELMKQKKKEEIMMLANKVNGGSPKVDGNMVVSSEASTDVMKKRKLE
ncbi:Cac2 protein [Saccharomycopsis crataegensis]|uniref:Cac2 protein n=1 Tax=Saccharomycopsis crataegensis TaxID=43959 RepID=A0AAV5QRM3_9ASCO|nr:Cac2 protein [Saccharomycopsis crataegensis]